MDSIEFIRQFPVKAFKKGQILRSEGEINDTLLALRSGYVKVTSVSDAGIQRLLWIAGRYDIAPTEQLFSSRSTLHFFYTALSDCEVYEIDKNKFLEYARATPALMMEIATSMSIHYDDLLRRIDSIEQVDIRHKLIFTLIYLAKRFSASDEIDLHEIDLKLTHTDIAEMIGSTRETTSVEMIKLRDQKAIKYDRTHFILNIPKLESLVSE
jgi:CRP-like cAMP-binding protein